MWLITIAAKRPYAAINDIHRSVPRGTITRALICGFLRNHARESLGKDGCYRTCHQSYGNPLASYVLQNQMDIFVIAHSLGWFAKAIILRDYWFCWILSIMFEIMEYSLAHQLPNFAECWWDHVGWTNSITQSLCGLTIIHALQWILDLILTNWVGTVIGMKFCEHFSMKVSIAIWQRFVAKSWRFHMAAIFMERYQRDSKLSGETAANCTTVHTAQLDTLWMGINKIVHEFRGGFIAALLGMRAYMTLPSGNTDLTSILPLLPDSAMRTECILSQIPVMAAPWAFPQHLAANPVLLHGIAGCARVIPIYFGQVGGNMPGDLFERMFWILPIIDLVWFRRRCKRLGMHAWMATANIMTELLINIKFGRGEFPEPAPKEIIYFWIGFVVLLLTYAIFHFLIPFLRGKNVRRAKSRSSSRSGSPIKTGYAKVGKSKSS